MNDNDYLLAYRQYLGIKQHFADKFVRYTGANSPRLNRVKVETLLKRKDLSYFVKVTERHKNPIEREQFFISVFLHDRNHWIGDLCTSAFDIIHSSRMGRIGQNLKYTVNSELDQISLMTDDSLDDLLTLDGDRPLLLKKFKKVSDETLVCLSRHSNFLEFSSYNPLWENRRLAISRYSMLLDTSNVDDDVERYFNEMVC